MKRIISVLLAAFMLLALLAGCAEKTPAGEASKTRSFTDSTDRTLELPADISAIAVTGQMAQILSSPWHRICWWGQPQHGMLLQNHLLTKSI